MATELQLALATKDATDGRFATVANAWGIFLDGVHVLEPDSFLGYEYMNESKVSQYPQQSGAFQSYNKVATPFDVRVRMSKGGTIADRTAYLAEVEAAAKSLNLYSVVTPEKTYLNTNIVKVSHRHAQREGATLLVVELWFLEIRNTATAQFYQTTSNTMATPVTPITNPVKPTSADPTVVGKVRTIPFVAQSLQDVVNQALQDQAWENHTAMSHVPLPKPPF